MPRAVQETAFAKSMIPYIPCRPGVAWETLPDWPCHLEGGGLSGTAASDPQRPLAAIGSIAKCCPRADRHGFDLIDGGIVSQYLFRMASCTVGVAKHFVGPGHGVMAAALQLGQP